MNPNNNQGFSDNNQKYQQNHNFNNSHSTLDNEKELKPLLPYHQYINKNKINSNQNLSNNYSQLQYSNLNNSYQNIKYSPSNQNYHSGVYYNYSPYKYTNLPTYQQFKKQNETSLFGYNNQVGNIELNNVKYSKQSDPIIIQPHQKIYQSSLNKKDDFNKNNQRYISNSENYILNPKETLINELNNQKKHKYIQKNQYESKKIKKDFKQEKLLLDYPMSQQQVSESEFEQDEQIFYEKLYSNERDHTKTKTIYKKKDSILDSPQEIRKWIEMRKKNYPRRLHVKEQNKQQDILNDDQKKQMSNLQKKIRKKIQIINGDTRNLLKKLRNIDILRRIVSDPKILQKNKKQFKKNIIKNRNQVKQNFILQVQEQSEMSKQPIQLPAKKLDQPVQQQLQTKQLIHKTNLNSNKFMHQETIYKKQQRLSSQNERQQKNNILFQYVGQKVDKRQIYNPQRQNQIKKDFQRTGQPEEIISHLQEKQKQDKEWLNTLFDYKSNSHNYRYKIQTLQVNFKLQQIFQQTSHLLQAIRYIVKQNFLQENN